MLRENDRAGQRSTVQAESYTIAPVISGARQWALGPKAAFEPLLEPRPAHATPYAYQDIHAAVYTVKLLWCPGTQRRHAPLLGEPVIEREASA